MSLKLDAKIMPNNIHIVHQQMKNDLQKELSMMQKLQSEGKLYGNELEKVRLNLREKELDIREKTGSHSGRNVGGFLVLSEDEKYITMKEFMDNIKSVDDETKNSFKNKKHLIEIQPEQNMMYFELIIKKQQEEIKKQQEEIDKLILRSEKQQEEINQLKSRSEYVV